MENKRLTHTPDRKKRDASLVSSSGRPERGKRRGGVSDAPVDGFAFGWRRGGIGDILSLEGLLRI